MRPLPLLALLLACAPDDGGRTRRPDADTGSTTAPGTPTPTTGTPSTTTPTGTLGSEFDCSAVPDLPLTTSNTPLDGPRGYNDLVFDDDGVMIGHDGNAFIAATDAVTASPLVPYADAIYKLDKLPGGDLVAVDSNGSVIRISPTGSLTTLATNLYGYGLAVGSDGMVYVATNYTAGADAIARVHPAVGGAEVLIDLSATTPRDIAFSRDFSVLYFGTQNGGDVYRIPLDANLDPTGDPELVATVPDGWHDTVEVDACGNLYVGSVFASAIFRIATDGTVSTFLDWSFNAYGHGMEWGDPAGGWSETTIYTTHPYVGSRVTEHDIGVPGARWPGTALGAVTL